MTFTTLGLDFLQVFIWPVTMAEFRCVRDVISVGDTELVFCYPIYSDSDDEAEKEKKKARAKKQAVRQVRQDCEI